MLRFTTIARRHVATATKTTTKTSTATASASATSTSTSTSISTPDPLEVIPSLNYKQAPNRNDVWSPSQKSRDQIYKNDPRFVGTDLSKQPQALAAIELIKNQPISFIHGNIAVCHGTDFVQGHPKVYINLDKEKAHTCGYCGARYARDELKGKL
jgi:NADH dehydrogenase (ubiquinone) Fe-S protein 6